MDVAALTLPHFTWVATSLEGGTGLMDFYVPGLLGQRKKRTLELFK